MGAINLRILGAIIVISGCGGLGFSLAADQLQQIRFLKGLQTAMKIMELELQFRLTALPELCETAGKQAGGAVKTVLGKLSQALEQQLLPDVSSCMQQILSEDRSFSRSQRVLLRQLGDSLGKYDLPGQLDGLASLQQKCSSQREQLEAGRSQRFRNYEILGLCAGVALVILFI